MVVRRKGSPVPASARHGEVETPEELEEVAVNWKALDTPVAILEALELSESLEEPLPVSMLDGGRRGRWAA